MNCPVVRGKRIAGSDLRGNGVARVLRKLIQAFWMVMDGPATTRNKEAMRRACLVHYQIDKDTCSGCASESAR